MRFTIALIVSLANVAIGFSQTGFVQGKVFDAETKRPLDNANIVIEGTRWGSTTDREGKFLIEGVPLGAHTIKASFLGYLTQRETVEVVPQGMTVEFSLSPTILPGQTVVITAVRGRERETPITFTSLKKDEIQKRYTYQDIPVLLSELPSITYYSESGNGIGYNYINLRGFDQRRLSVMINGIPQNDPEDHNVYWLDFPDLLASTEDIQVQRGAGSAFYGPPAIGGSVNLVTSLFSNDRSISLEAGAGSYNTQRYSVAIGSGLVEDRYVLFGRLSRLKSSGYREQSWSDFSSYFLGAVRYDEAMTTQIHLYGGPFKDHLAYYGIPKSDIKDRAKRRANPISRPEEIENFSQPHYELLHEWRLTDRLTLNNTIFLVEGEGFFEYDASWADTTMLRLTRVYGFQPTGNPENTIVRSFVDNTQWGWLPRVSYEFERGTTTVGAEVRIHRSHHYGNIRWAQNLPSGWNGRETADYRFYEYRGGKDMVSAYVHTLYRLRPSVTLMGSLQYVFNRYSLGEEKFIGTEFDVDYHFLNPKIGLNLNLTEQINAYMNVAYTSREPRRKNLYDATFSWVGEVPQFEQKSGRYDFSKPLVKPEQLLNLEVGSAYVDGGNRIGVNLYWMDFRNEIVSSGQLDLFGQPITGNAKRTRHAGIELSGSSSVINGFSLQGNATLSRNIIVQHTTYVEENNQIVPKSLNGHRIAGFPDLLANLRMTYDAELWFASLGMTHVGDRFTDNFEHPDRKADAYTVFNGIAGIRLRNVAGFKLLELRLQLNNIFDALYASHGEGDEFFPAAERNFFASLKINL
ncbi:MAG TPA: TonB-dependent receptor [Bacteroidota bacterium]|nr:TonB-dependent receptor [Bacteroidota bacterium]